MKHWPLMALLIPLQGFSNPPPYISPVLALNPAVMTNKELIDTATLFRKHEELPSVSELYSDEYNIWWFKATSSNNQFRDSNESLKILTRKAIKHYWDGLTENHPSYKQYDVIVTGSFSASKNDVDYGFEFKFDEIVFEIEYRW